MAGEPEDAPCSRANPPPPTDGFTMTRIIMRCPERGRSAIDKDASATERETSQGVTS